MPTRNRILEATEELCAKKLPHKITLDMVASTAKVGKGTIYEHFSSKDDLLGKLALNLLEDLRGEMMDAGLSTSGNSLNRLVELGNTYISFIMHHPMLMSIIVFLQESPPWTEPEAFDGFTQIESVMVSLIDSLVKLGVKEGTFRSDIDTRTLSFFIMGVFRARKPFMTKKQTVSDEDLLDLILNGAGSR